jgi:hypothetical protein
LSRRFTTTPPPVVSSPALTYNILWIIKKKPRYLVAQKSILCYDVVKAMIHEGGAGRGKIRYILFRA